MLFIFCFSTSIHGILAIVFRAKPWVGDTTGIITTLNSIPIMFCGLLGMLFFTTETGWAGTTSAWLLPAGDFLLTRTIPRRNAYLSRMVLYFMILLSPPLFNVSVSLAEPDLRMHLFDTKTQSFEAANKLTPYHDQFPSSSVISEGGINTLIIPFGAVLIALWQLWLAILMALAIQTATLLPLPSKVQMGLLMVLCFAPMFMVSFRLLGNPTMILENVFFWFAHHWIMNTIFTLGVFVFVQRMALTRIENLEII